MAKSVKRIDDWEVRTEHYATMSGMPQQNCVRGTNFDEIVVGDLGSGSCWLHAERQDELQWYIGLNGRDGSTTQLRVTLDRQGNVVRVILGDTDHIKA